MTQKTKTKRAGERVIERRLEFDLPVERVWRALTDAGELSSWFSDAADFEPVPGYVGSVTWADHGTFPLRVEEVDAPHRITWRWNHLAGGDFAEEGSTLVEWTLSPGQDGGTVLELVESGFTTDERQHENESGWTQELGHLTAFLEPARGPALRANHDVAVHVPDLDAAGRFYVDGLGLRLLERSDDHLEIDAGTLRLWVTSRPGPAGFVPSFDVADRAAARARVVGAGGGLDEAGYSLDPFGNPIDLIQR